MFLFCSWSEGSRMRSVRYHAVVAFGVTNDGALTPVAEEAAINPEQAVSIARRLGKAYAGAIAFSRSMNIELGRYGLAKVHAVEGLIPSDLASLCGQRSGSRRLCGEDPSGTIPKPRSRTNPVSVVVRPARWRR